MQTLSRSTHRVSFPASLIVLALLASCGGGSNESVDASAAATTATDPITASAAAEPSGVERIAARIQAFISPNPVPADANVRGMWSPVYNWPVIAVHSAILPDGRVLTYGSDVTGLQTGHAVYDIWDNVGAPDTGHMTLPNNTGSDIFCSSQLLLPATGSVFMAGGDNWTGSSTTNTGNNNSNVLDTRTNLLSRGNNMQRARWYSTSTTLINGETYIQGGNGGGDRPEIRGVDGSFRLMAGIDTTGVEPLFPRNFVAPDGRVFGYDSNSGLMYYIDTRGNGSLTPSGRFDTSLTGTDRSTTAMYRPGRILQFGGSSNGAYTIDITSGTPVVTPTQSLRVNRIWANATILADGRVAATSGSQDDNVATRPTRYVEIWDPVTAQWMQGPSAQKTRMYHSNAILLPDASVLVTGGGAAYRDAIGDADHANLSAEIYYPSYLFAAGGVRAVRPTITTAPDYIDIGKTYGVDLAGAGQVSRVTLVKTGAASHSVNFDQRFLDLTYKLNGNRLTFQAPTRAGEATPGYYMLFVFNAAGVPSVAKIMRLGVAADPNPAITPVLANPGPQTTVIGTAASFTPIASDPNGDRLSFAASGLPTGLVIDAATGRISGTPTANGSFAVVITATDGVNTTSAAFNWTVQAASPLVLTPPAPPAFVAINGTATYTARASGGSNLQYRWNFGDGTATTAWSPSATVTHTYAASGIYTVTVSVTDASGLLQSRSFSQVVVRPSTARAPNASTNVLTHVPAGANARLWVVNQDNNSLSAFDAVSFAKIGEYAVGAGPRSIALAANGRLWVTNKLDASISIVNAASGAVERVLALPRGSQPFGVVVSPASATAFVALEAGGAVLRFNTDTYAQTASIAVGLNVRHLSISGDGANLYASRFITPPLPGEGTAVVATSASTGGEVLQISTASATVLRSIVLQHGERPDAENQGRGIPNYLGAAVISPDGTQAYVPGKQDNIKRGALRDRNGLNFQNTVRAISARINLAGNSETLAARIDHDNASLASAAVYDRRGAYLFVALETSREVAVINAVSGAQLFRADVGRAPEGLALSPDGKRLFVSNFMDRTVTAFDLAPLLDQGMFNLPVLATLGAVGTERLAANVLLGKQLFYDARDPRLARDRYMSCASCHNDGGQDGRTWDFTGQGEGLRNTIALRGRGGIGQGALHWSANFDEVQDFEGQIRTLAGGTGLMADAQFNTGTVSQPLGDKKAGRSVELDAMAAYLASLNSFAPSPYRAADGTLSTAAQAGRSVFQNKNCAQCHTGTAFTASSDASALRNVGTLKPSSGQRLGGPLPGIDVPTLRDVWATAPYLHDGSAPTLEAAVAAHTNLTLTSAELGSVAAYLREIGSDEVSAPAISSVGTGLLGQYFNNETLSGTPVFTRTELPAFDWGIGPPAAGMRVDNFSARWTGSVVVPFTGGYKFVTNSDDGVRLWVNGVLLINNWNPHGAVIDISPSINLVAGQSYSIRMEYYERTGNAVAMLGWITPGSTGYAFIPVGNLFPQ